MLVIEVLTLHVWNAGVEVACGLRLAVGCASNEAELELLAVPEARTLNLKDLLCLYRI